MQYSNQHIQLAWPEEPLGERDSRTKVEHGMGSVGPTCSMCAWMEQGLDHRVIMAAWGRLPSRSLEL